LHSQCGICGVESDTRTNVSLSTVVFTCDCHSTSSPYSYSFICLCSYILSNWQHQ